MAMTREQDWRHSLPFKGLFIGIDRYASPGINWLNCARRDARALRGLFMDSMGGETALPTDEQATSVAIAEEFRKLSSAAPDDVVVIAFSGHGSETHEIVTFDTDPYDLAGTSIPLATIG
jgi:helicase